MSPQGKRVAEAISFVLNPSLWTGGFLVLLAATFGPVGARRWVAAALGLTFTGLVPVGLLFVLNAKGHLSDVEMSIRSERGIVYKACAGSYAVGAAALYLVGAPWPMWGLVMLHVPYALLLAVLNRRWKVSIHTTGLAGMWAAALVLFGLNAWWLAIVLVAAAWARWAARAHTVGELTSGATIGFILTGGGLFLFRHLVVG